MSRRKRHNSKIPKFVLLEYTGDIPIEVIRHNHVYLFTSARRHVRHDDVMVARFTLKEL